jgi:CRISPR-associated exonuclease Cas4
MTYSEDELLPISALTDIVFCPRRAALQQLERVWEENVATVEGHNLHDRVHDGATESRGGVRVARGIKRHEQSFEVQLCAQAMCLEEMLNCKVPAGALFYGISHRRQDVPFDHALRQATESAARRLHELIEAGITPKAEYSKRCKNCSLFTLCAPKTGNIGSVEKYLAKAVV